HFHTDHPVFSCSKIEQKQLNTWVSFQSAEQPLLGQFSVSGNTQWFTVKKSGLQRSYDTRPGHSPGQRAPH
ncbi:hypothetical protein, partial [Pseudomonas aeruginosa]|uniref:hypothetical protein n=1 Tax=Pseudomonas aeruginosa TaxID=287 RepID=UPI003FD004F6